MLHRTVNYVRVPQFEDSQNPAITVKVKDSKNKRVAIIGVYRQWNARGEINANNASGIKRQVRRLKMLCSNIEKYARISRR